MVYLSDRRICQAIGLCILAFTISSLLAGCGCLFGPGVPVRGRPQIGRASWYGREYHGRRTANGEIFDMYKLTAAHRKLKLGTRVRVTNLKNGRSVVVRINDRGPFARGRIIDLSYAAARELRMLGDGIVEVRVEIVD